jgi:hypothetical protein
MIMLLTWQPKTSLKAAAPAMAPENFPVIPAEGMENTTVRCAVAVVMAQMVPAATVVMVPDA